MKFTHLKPSFSDIVFITVFIIALTFGTQMLGIDSDLGRHIVLGNIILSKQTVPTQDLFSHTRAGLSRPPYEWLSQVLFALGYRLLGMDGVILLTSLTLAAAFSLLYKIAFNRSGSPLISLTIVLISAGASSLHWLPRPHIFTFLLLAIWIELLESLTKKDRQTKYFIYFLIMVLWANLHGGFIFGILAWAAYLSGWLWNVLRNKPASNIGKKLILVGGVSLLATIVTPDLWRNWAAVLNNSSVYILNRTVETMAPNLLDQSVLPFTLLLLSTILLAASNWKDIEHNHIFLLLGFGILSLAMIRNIPLFAIVSAPILSALLANRFSNFLQGKKIDKRFSGFEQASKLSAWKSIVTVSVLGFFVHYNFKNEQNLFRFDSTVFPVNAANYIRENPIDGNMFNQFNWGGYFIYSLWPDQLVFIDSQTDFYGEALTREYVQVESLQPGWENVLAKHDVSWVITQNSQPLEFALIENGWDLLYEDSTTVIFRKP